MKKLIILAMIASINSYALDFLGVIKTYCLAVYYDLQGNMIAGSCDMSAINRSNQAQIMANGCAAGQIAFKNSSSIASCTE
jgi:hypothetical protein